MNLHLRAQLLPECIVSLVTVTITTIHSGKSSARRCRFITAFWLVIAWQSRLASLLALVQVQVPSISKMLVRGEPNPALISGKRQIVLKGFLHSL